jgi:hypothetical protein
MGALIAAGGILSLPSCGHDQKLESIQVQPSSFTFLQNVPGTTANYKAYGTYIHPPATKDISTEVTWYANVPGVATMASGATNGGVLTTAGGCGTNFNFWRLVGLCRFANESRAMCGNHPRRRSH